MNTEEEIQQAMTDYRMKQNGFETAKTWKSDYLQQRWHQCHKMNSTSVLSGQGW